jgi:hypothetical protein
MRDPKRGAAGPQQNPHAGSLRGQVLGKGARRVQGVLQKAVDKVGNSAAAVRKELAV